MGFLIYCFIVFFAFHKPKSKKIALIAVLFMVVLLGLNSATADYTTYRWVYNDLYTWKGVGLLGEHEPGYDLLMIICKSIGLSYQNFRIVIAIICAFLTWLTVNRLTDYPAVTLAIYILTPFLGFVSGIRAGLASSIVMYAITFLVNSERKPIIKYVVGILIATMFHYSSIAYLLLLVVRFQIPTKKLLIICVLFGGGIAFAVHGTSLLYDVLSLITDNEKVLGWFDPNNPYVERMRITGKIYATGCVVYNVFLAYFALYKIDYDNLSTRHKNTVYYSLRICILLISFLPVFYLNGTFLRYLGEVQLLLICACAESSGYFSEKKPVGWKRIFDPIVLLIAVNLFSIVVDNRSIMQYTDYHYLSPFIENYLFTIF